jgi:hypothetical protein
MGTSRNLVALGLFLFATTFLWLAAAMADRTRRRAERRGR